MTDSAGLRKNDSLDGPVTAYARHAAEQGVARNLSRHAAPVGLQHNFVLRHLREVIAIGQPSLDDAQTIKRISQTLPNFAAASRIFIKDSHLRSRTGSAVWAGGMMPGR